MNGHEGESGGGASRSTDPASGSSSATDVSIREFIEMMIGYERRGTWMLFGFIGAIAAFGWSQIQRRLEILNHENARVASVAASTVSSDTYASDSKRRDDERDKLDSWRSGVDQKFTQSVTKEEAHADVKQSQRSSIDTSTRLLLAVFAAVSLGIGLLTYQASHHTHGTPAPIVRVCVATTAVAKCP